MPVQTVVRIVIPIVAALGGAIGAFSAVVKLLPERASIVVGYQGQVIDDLMKENARQAQLIASLEERVKALEDAPPRYLS